MKLSIVTVLTIVAVILAACAPAATPAPAQPTKAPAAPAPTQPPAAKPRGTLRFGQRAADLSNLDPHYASSTADRSIVDMVFNGLIRYKPGDASQFEADLASAMPQQEVKDGKQIWTFTLRKGVMCQPTEGVPSYELTSDDVIYSFKKAADKDRSAYSGDYAGMTFDAVDPYTVKITLDAPLSSALFYPKVANYSGGFIVCKKAAEKLGATGMKTNPVGTGPFMFKKYTPQEKIELVAFDNYFRGKPKLDGIDYRFIADLNSLELGLRGGQLDVINGGPDDTWVAKMQTVPNVKVDVFGVGEVAILYFDVTKAPLDKLQVRQAIAYALSRDEFLALAGPKVAQIVYSPVPVEFLPGGLTRDEVAQAGVEYKTDVNKAKSLLAEAGYANGFSMDLNVSEMTGYNLMYGSLQAQLAKVGIKLNLQVVDHPSYGTLVRKDSNPIVLYIAWRPNADNYLTRFFLSDSIVVTGAKPDTNFSHYTAIDDLIKKARVEQDPAKQIAMWKEAQIKILQDMAAYPIQYQNQVYARSASVDYGHPVKSVLALYPGVDETTSLLPK